MRSPDHNFMTSHNTMVVDPETQEKCTLLAENVKRVFTRPARYPARHDDPKKRNGLINPDWNTQGTRITFEIQGEDVDESWRLYQIVTDGSYALTKCVQWEDLSSIDKVQHGPGTQEGRLRIGGYGMFGLSSVEELAADNERMLVNAISDGFELMDLAEIINLNQLLDVIDTAPDGE